VIYNTHTYNAYHGTYNEVKVGDLIMGFFLHSESTYGKTGCLNEKKAEKLLEWENWPNTVKALIWETEPSEI